MPDPATVEEAVIDTCVVFNAGLLHELGRTDHACVQFVLSVAAGACTPRYSSALIGQYNEKLPARFRGNDVVEAFVQLLGDGAKSREVKKGNLTRQERVRALNCDWPAHDFLILAPALHEPTCGIKTTEAKLGRLQKKIKRTFDVVVEHIEVSPDDLGEDGAR